MISLIVLVLVLFLVGLVRATVGVAAVGALPLGFRVKLGLVRGKFLPAGLHAAEASYVSSSSISAFEGCYCSCGLVLQRCLLRMLLPFLTFWMVLLVLILPFMLFGLGFV